MTTKVAPIDDRAAQATETKSSGEISKKTTGFWARGGTGADLLLLLVACLSILFFKLGANGVIDPGDGYYTETAREMVDTGDYITPQLNYQMYFSKPVLIYWLISSAYHAFGVNEFAARFWSATAAVILVGFCYWTTRALAGRRAGVIAGLALVTSPAVAMYGRMAQIDMVFTAILGIALCALVMTVALGAKRWWLLFYTALGLSILTKGPAGCVFFAFAGLLYLAWRRPNKAEFIQLAQRLHLVAGLLIMLAVAAPWYICVGLATNWLWPRIFFMFENFGRFNGETNYVAPKIWFYLPVLAYSFAPWAAFLPAAFKDALNRKAFVESAAQENSASQSPALHVTTTPSSALHAATTSSHAPTRPSSALQSSSAQPAALQEGMLVFAAWVAAVFIFMSLSRTQLSYYIMPLFTGAAALVGIVLNRWIERYEANSEASRYYKIVSPLLALVGIVGSAGGLVYLAKVPDLSVESHVMSAVGAALFAAGMIWQFFASRKAQIERSIFVLLGTMAITLAMTVPVAFEIGWHNANYDLYKLVQRINGTSRDITVFKSFNPSAMFYLRRPIDFIFEAKLYKKAEPGAVKPVYILVQDKDLEPLVNRCGQDHLTLVDREGRWQKYLATDISVHKQEPMWMLYTYCYDALTKDKSHWGLVGVPYGAGVRIVHHK